MSAKSVPHLDQRRSNGPLLQDVVLDSKSCHQSSKVQVSFTIFQAFVERTLIVISYNPVQY